ncbi:MAG: transposase family protein [Anaerolineales bacterium]|nr:transposase family protein [Anaerolineales bacterium]
MKERPFRSIEEHFEEISDPQQGQNVQHKLLDIIIIAICGGICDRPG